MKKDNKDHGVVEIIMPNETVQARIEAIKSIARTCEKLAESLCTSALIVNINGNIIASATNGVKVK